MANNTLLIGTRKGLFILEGRDRADWKLRGPYCDAWPVYHAIHDPSTDTIYAAASSDWHGQGVWRSTDHGETWSLSSEGIGYGDDGPRLSKVSSLAAGHGRVLVGAETAGIFESRDDGETWSLLSTLAEQPGREGWNDPANQPPGHLGIPFVKTFDDDPKRLLTIVQGVGAFETTDDGKTWTPRNKGLRRDWPAEYEEIGFCVHRLVHSPDPQRLYQQNHVGVHRSDDGGASWTEITEGLPSEFGFVAAAHPHDKDSFYVVPLDPGHGRTMPDGHASVWRTSDAGSSWRRLDDGLPQEGAYVGVLRGAMTIDDEDSPGLYFGTSTGQVFASVDEGEHWTQIADYLPDVWSVEVMADR